MALHNDFEGSVQFPEALHQNSLIGKDLLESEQTYSDMMGSMLSSLGNLDDDDDDEDGFDDEDDFYRRYR